MNPLKLLAYANERISSQTPPICSERVVSFRIFVCLCVAHMFLPEMPDSRLSLYRFTESNAYQC